ncbi:MAG: hypothetical protein HC895_08330 [Leptolyngbyaceae cyanobacterium SM1_3_5]|nr:hypothetical protein [Leptolyngbyaceae cyanobacterium SM1_3_5]
MELTAAAIAALAFSKFLESSVGKAGEKFTEAAIAKMDELRQKIWSRFRGNSRAETALTAIEQGSKSDFDRLAVYLQDVMNEDPEFASQVQAIAQEIHAGKLQDNSTMTQNNYDSSTGYQIKNEGGENYMGNITINKT